MKKLLIATYMFPPISGGGTMRPLKFIKYLPQFGIDPVVFCPRNARWKAYDHENLKLPFLKNLPVYRCGTRRLERYYCLRYGQNLRRHPLFYLLAARYFWSLDIFSAWYFECRREFSEIATRENVDCVLTTSPPHSIHLFGHYLKRTLNIPWIMDIRDAMAVDPNRRKSPIEALQTALENYYEKKFYARADAIISVSDPIVESIRARHADLALSAKTHTLSNGFDEEDFTALDAVGPDERRFTVTYTGSFMGKQSPEFFLKAVGRLIETKAIDPSDLLIRFIGYFDEHTLCLFDRYAASMAIQVIAFQPYTEALRYQAASHVLLLIVNIEDHEGGAQTTTGKFFEYLGAGRPIMALVPNGPLKETIMNGRFGRVAPPKDVPAIAQAFKQLYDEWKSRGQIEFFPDETLKNRFTRRQLTGRLAQIVDAIAP